jgi:hypothetical protein
VIVRILTEGQCRLPDNAVDELNELDAALQAAVDAGDERRFHASLAGLLGRVRQLGTMVPNDELVTSDLVLPSEQADLAEVRELLGDEGLIPG